MKRSVDELAEDVGGLQASTTSFYVESPVELVGVQVNVQMPNHEAAFMPEKFEGIYSLNGVRVGRDIKSLPAGIYLYRTDKGCRKVIRR